MRVKRVEWIYNIIMQDSILSWHWSLGRPQHPNIFYISIYGIEYVVYVVYNLLYILIQSKSLAVAVQVLEIDSKVSLSLKYKVFIILHFLKDSKPTSQITGQGHGKCSIAFLMQSVRYAPSTLGQSAGRCS